MKTQLISKAFLCLLLLNTSSLFSQQRYEIGLSGTSFNRDRIELNQRLNLNFRWSILMDVSYGTDFERIWSEWPASSNGQLQIHEIRKYTFNYLTAKIGVMRRLRFGKLDNFYCAAKFGIGWEHLNLLRHRELLKIIDFEWGQPVYELLDTWEKREIRSYSYSRFDLLFGMNVPLTERLTANWSTGVVFRGSQIELPHDSFMKGTLAAGLTYYFGKKGKIE